MRQKKVNQLKMIRLREKIVDDSKYIYFVCYKTLPFCLVSLKIKKTSREDCRQKNLCNPPDRSSIMNEQKIVKVQRKSFTNFFCIISIY